MSKDLRGAETSQPTIRNSHLHSSGHWNSWYLAPPALELVQELGRRATDYKHGRLQRDHLPVPAVISGFAKGELTRSRFRTRSQPASLLQPVIYFLINSINAYGFVLAGQKNKNAINIALNTLALWHWHTTTTHAVVRHTRRTSGNCPPLITGTRLLRSEVSLILTDFQDTFSEKNRF